VLARRPDGEFVQLIQYQIARARGLYASSLRGLPALTPSGRLTTLAAARFYAGILNEIEAAGCDVFRGRAHVSSVRKLRQTPSLAAEFIRLSLAPARFA
jgi:phytoene synthase